MFQGIIIFSAVSIGFAQYPFPPSPLTSLIAINTLRLFQIVGFIYGYVAEQFGWTVYIVMAGFAFSCLVRSLWVFGC